LTIKDLSDFAEARMEMGTSSSQHRALHRDDRAVLRVDHPAELLIYRRDIFPANQN
jgi:hypothetical protein